MLSPIFNIKPKERECECTCTNSSSDWFIDWLIVWDRNRATWRWWNRKSTTCLRRCPGWWWDIRVPGWWTAEWSGWSRGSFQGGGRLPGSAAEDKSECNLVCARGKNKRVWTGFPFVHLVSCRHDGHDGELVHADLRHSHSSQQANLRWTHVGSFSQHTLSPPDVVSYWPANAPL